MSAEVEAALSFAGLLQACGDVDLGRIAHPAGASPPPMRSGGFSFATTDGTAIKIKAMDEARASERITNRVMANLRHRFSGITLARERPQRAVTARMVRKE